MINKSEDFNKAIVSPSREMKALIKVYNAENELIQTLTPEDYIANIEVVRSSEDSKVFGMCVSQQLKIELLDINRELSFSIGDKIEVLFGVKCIGAATDTESAQEYVDYTKVGVFYLQSQERDENSNSLTVTAYDLFDKLSNTPISEIGAPEAPYTVLTFTQFVATQLGFELDFANCSSEEENWNILLPEGANLEFAENEGVVEKTTAKQEDEIIKLNVDNAIVTHNDNGTVTITYTDSDLVEVMTETHFREHYGISTESSTESDETEDEEGEEIPVEVEEEQPKTILTDNTSIKELLKQITEVTQTICYFNGEGVLIFKRLTQENDELDVNRDNYFTLTTQAEVNLNGIVETNSLGDALSAKLEEDGFLQKVVDNVFLVNKEEVQNWLANGLTVIGNTKIVPFELDWRGNPALEIGDRLGLMLRDESYLYSYLLNDKLSYDGGFKSEIFYHYSDSDAANEDGSPNNISEAISQTFASVDKINKKITLQAAEISDNYDELTGELSKIQNSSTLTLTPEGVTAEITTAIDGGVSVVKNTTGTFDENGLTIKKYDETGEQVDGLETKIDNNGMTISQDSEEVLKVNNDGVNAYNLKAKNGITIIDMCRFQPYNGKVGLFWVQGEEE